jgi:hypothetical protein
MANYTLNTIDKLTSKIRRRVDNVVRDMGYAGHAFAVRSSPVWTGTYRGSWVQSRGKPNKTALPYPGSTKINFYGVPAVRKLAADVNATSVFLTNSTKHAKGIETGSVTSTPSGVRSLTVTFLTSNSRAFVKAAKR